MSLISSIVQISPRFLNLGFLEYSVALKTLADFQIVFIEHFPLLVGFHCRHVLLVVVDLLTGK